MDDFDKKLIELCKANNIIVQPPSSNNKLWTFRHINGNILCICDKKWINDIEEFVKYQASKKRNNNKKFNLD